MVAVIQAAATQTALTALAQKAETARVWDAFRDNGLDPVLLKGWPLAERLFDSAGMRHAKDIDLHVSPCELPRAVAVLEALGYAPLPSHQTRVRLARHRAPALLAETNDIAWMHPDGHVVELHWRLTHLAGWVALGALSAPLATHPLDRTGRQIRVLGDRANLIYLSVHGQLHLWGRLRWLYDIARLTTICAEDELRAALREAEAIGAGRAVKLSVWLAHMVFASKLPAGWPAPNWVERHALRRFIALMAAPAGEPGHPLARFGYYLGILCLGEGIAQRLAAPRYALWRNLRLHFAGRRQ